VDSGKLNEHGGVAFRLIHYVNDADEALEMTVVDSHRVALAETIWLWLIHRRIIPRRRQPEQGIRAAGRGRAVVVARGALTAIGYNAGMYKLRHWQFSLRTILLFVVAASLALAAMRYATPAWASAIITATVFTLLLSTALAACTRGDRRSFWFGFAICGIGYFAVVMTPVAPEIKEQLATTRAVTFLRDSFHPLENVASNQGYPPSPTTWEWDQMAVSFRLIGQCLWALILATLGGSLVRWIVLRGVGGLKNSSPSRS
jgi:hypothetical protein